MVKDLPYGKHIGIQVSFTWNSNLPSQGPDPPNKRNFPSCSFLINLTCSSCSPTTRSLPWTTIADLKRRKERKKEDSDLARPHQQCWSFDRVKIAFLSYLILSHIQSQPATFLMNANFRRWHTIVKKLFHRITAGWLQRITRCGNMMEDTKII